MTQKKVREATHKADVGTTYDHSGSSIHGLSVANISLLLARDVSRSVTTSVEADPKIPARIANLGSG
jgi:hypothetical protein